MQESTVLSRELCVQRHGFCEQVWRNEDCNNSTQLKAGEAKLKGGQGPDQ